MMNRVLMQRQMMCSRNFSALLVPLHQQQDLPAEIANPVLTRAYFAELDAKYAEFNDNCAVELEEMNKNVISNIIARGGHKGWETADNLDDLTKSFEFQSFEAAQAFCQNVAEAAHKMDHHPEWKLSNNGCTVDVRLTSHFAGNKVTRLDFELAEAMNEAYTVTNSTFKMFSYFTDAEWLSIKIGAGMVAFGAFWWRWATRPQRHIA